MMKAFLLAAGEGTRLRPLTYEIPKCLVPINGRPLIEFWLDIFEEYGINEVLINTFHLADKVKSYISKNNRGIQFKVTYEKELLGSGGTIKANWDFVKDEEFFYIFYADNLTNINLKKMLEFHLQKNRQFTLALYKVKNPKECGIVEIGKDSVIISFEEKPANPKTDLAFAGIMIGSQKLKEYFPRREKFDMGYDVLPNLKGVAYGYIVNEYLIDIGTPEKLKKAELDIKNKKFIPVKQDLVLGGRF